MTRRTWLIAIVAVTLALSCAVAISWLTFARQMPVGDPFSALARPWIYVSQALMAAATGFVTARVLGSAVTRGQLAVVMFSAWIGELVLLTVFGTLVANELTPLVAWLYWLMATGFGMQPLAATAGAFLPSPVVIRR